MGRLILLLLLIVAVVIVWKAFGPSSWKRNSAVSQQPQREIKGPDDDEDFLWNLEKEAFKQRRARERAEEEQRRFKPKPADDPDSSHPDHPDNNA